MKASEFIDRVLPPGNHYLAYEMPTQDGRMVYGHKSFEGTRDGLRIAKGMLDQDLFIALASFEQAKVLDEVRGFMKSKRKQDNVAFMKALYLDLDFKNYGSTEETARALADFIKESGLDRPSIIVNSGGGFHVYWTLDTPLTPDAWKPLATGLAAKAQRSGLKADLQCTIDSARILRLPGSFNYKYDPPRKVAVVSHNDTDFSYEHLKAQLHGVTTGPEGGLKASAEVVSLFKDQSVDDLSAGVDLRGTFHVGPMLEQCPTLADVVARRGEGDSYYLWKHSLHLLAYMSDGEDYIEAVSDGHAGYDPDEAAIKFDESLKSKDEGRVGPTTCDAFSKESSKCQSCPFYGKIKSPIILGRHRDEANELPDPSYVLNGCTYRNVRKDDPDGNVTVERELIAEVAIERWEYVRDSSGNKYLCMTINNDGVRSVLEIPPEVQTDPKTLRKDLMRGGLVVQSTHLKRLEETMTSWRQKLHRESAKVGDRPAFGWVIENGKAVGFAVNGVLHRHDGTMERAGVVDSGLKRVFTESGSADAWEKMAHRVEKDTRPEAHLFVAASFAAPMMRFGEANSFTFSTFSRRSGAGKSTLLRFAQAVWGHPISSASSLNDTANSIIQRMSRQRDLPMAWDELRHEENIKNFVTILFQNTQGKSKARLNQSAEIKDAPEINSIMLACSNDPLLPAVRDAASFEDAGILRMLECELPMLDNVDLEYGKLLSELNNNYGQKGHEWAAVMAENFDQFTDIIARIRAHISEEWQEQRHERFWFAAAAAVLGTTIMLRKHGIISLDAAAIKRRMKRAIEDGRLFVSDTEQSMVNTIPAVVFANQSSVLITQWRKTQRGPASQPVPILKAPHIICRVHVCLDEDILILPERVIRDYCKEHRLSFHHVRQFITQELKIAQQRVGVGKGTQFANPNVIGYEFPARATLGEGFLERWVSQTSTA